MPPYFFQKIRKAKGEAFKVTSIEDVKFILDILEVSA